MNDERHGFFDKEMQALESFVGKEVKVVYISRGGKKIEGIKGILSNVSAYDSVTVDNSVYYFLGDNSTILCIGYDEDKHIYFNRNIPIDSFLNDYPKYFWDGMLLMSEQESYLGYSVKKEDMLKGR